MLQKSNWRNNYWKLEKDACKRPKNWKGDGENKMKSLVLMCIIIPPEYNVVKKNESKAKINNIKIQSSQARKSQKTSSESDES